MNQQQHSADTQPIDEAIVHQAINWHVQIESSESPLSTINACNQWRAQNPDHELAWQRLTRINQTFSNTPTTSTLVKHTLIKTDADYQDVTRRQAIKRVAGSALAVGAVALVAQRQGALEHLQADYASSSNARFHILEDNSELWLNRDSTVEVAFSPLRRDLALTRGEMTLSVAKARSPLHIDMPFGQLKTASSKIFVRRTNNHAIVQVSQGKASLLAKGSKHRLTIEAGKTYRVDAHRVESLNSNTFDYTSWVDGIFSVRNMPMKSFLQELSRYYPGYLKCDSQLDNTLVSGVYQLADMDTILKTIALSAGAKVRYLTRFWATISPN
ncbi:FecR domain-containing protein [Psychrobium sp. MM17-31]|uniref:FecR domain-containing protein n=1 Tax=Psychrobium sp. MM17-31 TaxID=2917758 RepID=UPI001EF46D1E|nr:FecR domain-containing protein [Psychrobium sp. MM17-31]MCG7532314.1 FecR domain-containing protein [Psychrobium sp. MM17-31]